jgi:hypothetical protein
MQRTACLALVVLLSVLGCGDDAGGDDDDVTADADPNAPDGSTQPDASAITPDADLGGGADGAVGIDCNGTPCEGDDICCVTQGGGGASAECLPEGDCMGAVVTCDGPEDCGDGEVCCGTIGGGSGSAECTADTCQFTICHTPADCPNATDQCCDFGVGSSICTSICF